MARISVILNEDHLKLIKNLRFSKLDVYDNKDCIREVLDRKYYGIDTYSLYGGTFLYEDMACILGVHDQVYKETLEDFDGPKYPKELMDRFIDLDEYITEHLSDIEEILHQFCDVGLKVGKYSCRDNEHIWRYVGQVAK